MKRCFHIVIILYNQEVTELKEEVFMYSLPVEQSNPFRADKIMYFSQLLSFPKEKVWEYVAKRACGITSAAMAISISDKKIDPFKVFVVAIKLHRVPSKENNYWLQVNNNGTSYKIPVGNHLDPEIISQGFQYTNSNSFSKENYFPVVSLERGYDHRGSEELFKQFGIEAKIQGNKKDPLSEKQLIELVQNGHVFMASVKNSITPWMEGLSQWGPSSHVVLVTDVVLIKGEPHYLITDPYSADNFRISLYRPTSSFHKVEFRGYGTAVKVE